MQKVGSAATTLSSCPENSISISVFCKKVEAPVLLVVRDQEGALFRQWQKKPRKVKAVAFFLHPIDSVITLSKFRERDNQAQWKQIYNNYKIAYID